MTILAEILGHKLEEVDQARRSLPLNELKARLRNLPAATPGRFRNALTASGGISLIGEIKKASPSQGLIRKDFAPEALAAAYARGGAAALSVLTDRQYFQGDNRFLALAREASGLPVLRKDFTVSDWQVYESRLLGADCILLIVAALTDSRLAEFSALAAELGLDALVEVHNEQELMRAAACGAALIGVNNRDLGTFEVSLEVSARLAASFPDSAVKISESGIQSHADIKRLEALGYTAVLVGEHLMRQADLEAAVRTLLSGAPE